MPGSVMTGQGPHAIGQRVTKYAVDLVKLLMLIVLGLRVIDMDGGFKTIVLLQTFALIQTLHQRPVKYVIRTFRLGCR